MCIVQSLLIRRQINVFKYTGYGMPFVTFSIIMYGILRAWKFVLHGYFITLVIKVLVGGILYCVMAGILLLIVRKKNFNIL